MLFKDIKKNDLDKVNKLVESVFLEFIAFKFTSKGIEKFKNIIKKEQLEKSINDFKCFLIGCFDCDRLVGVIAIKNYSHINLLFVHKDYHKKGIAKILFKKALRKCMELFPNIKKLTVNSSLYAVEVYKRFGFKVVKEKEFSDGMLFIPMEICFEIRKAKSGESEKAFLLARNTFEWMDLEKIEYLKNPDETIYDMINDFKDNFEYNGFYFLEINGEISGLFKISDDYIFSNSDDNSSIYVKYLTINKKWFGFGIGHFIFEKVKGILISNGLNEVKVVSDGNLKKLCNYYENKNFFVKDEKIISKGYNYSLHLRLYQLKYKDLNNNFKSDSLYNNFAYYYDSYVNYFKEDIPIYLKYIKEDTKVLEIGCGTGRILKAILSKDCQVVGVDISENMLKIAEKRLAYYINNKMLKLINIDLSERVLNMRFDRIFMTFYTFNYLLKDNKRINMLKNIYSMLNEKGIIVIDLFYPKTFKDSNLDNKCFLKKIYFNEEIINLKDKRKMIGDLEERVQVFEKNGVSEKLVTYRRFFNEEDIRNLLEYIGFSNIYMQKGYGIYSNIKSNEKDVNNYIFMAQK